MLSLSLGATLLAFASSALASSESFSPPKPPPKTGCGRNSVVTPGSGTFFYIQTSGGANATRSFKVDVPKGYNKNERTPLIFSFHGRSTTAEWQEALSEFNLPIFNKHAISVYPQGIDNQWESDPRAPANISDIDFTDKMIANLTSTFCIDESRIYASGKSNGGAMVNLLACSALSAKFAAFAPVSGAYYTSRTTTCNSTFARRPTPMLVFHGDNDTTVPYFGADQGYGVEPPIPVFMDQWVIRNKCKKSYVDQLYNKEVTRTRWDCQGQEAVLQHYRTHGLGHVWPSTEPNSDLPDGHTNYNATAVIMEFFRKYNL